MRVLARHRHIEHCSNLWVSVNLSAFQLPNTQSMTTLRTILAEQGAKPEHVILEVTETALAADIDGAIASLEQLKRCGARVAIDDFESGFSSLSTLANLPVDILKIDRSFVSGQTSITASKKMLEGILGLADKLGLAVIAEGIESPQQLALLQHLGCNTGQGYLLGRPTPAADLTTLLTAGSLLPFTQTGSQTSVIN
jgi:EAL domain-containing protein (putative c-di-GMP-specific phosphodiesterase class I)